MTVRSGRGKVSDMQNGKAKAGRRQVFWEFRCDTNAAFNDGLNVTLEEFYPPEDFSNVPFPLSPNDFRENLIEWCFRGSLWSF